MLIVAELCLNLRYICHLSRFTVFRIVVSILGIWICRCHRVHRWRFQLQICVKAFNETNTFDLEFSTTNKFSLSSLALPIYSLIDSFAFCRPGSVSSSNRSKSSSATRLRSTSISSMRFFNCLTTRVALISSLFTLSQSLNANDFSIFDLWFFNKPKWCGIPTSLNFFIESSACFSKIYGSLGECIFTVLCRYYF